MSHLGSWHASFQPCSSRRKRARQIAACNPAGSLAVASPIRTECQCKDVRKRPAHVEWKMELASADQYQSLGDGNAELGFNRTPEAEKGDKHQGTQGQAHCKSRPQRAEKGEKGREERIY